MNDYQDRLKRLAAESDETLRAPLWTFPPADCLAVLGARRRRFEGRSAVADRRVTTWADMY